MKLNGWETIITYKEIALSYRCNNSDININSLTILHSDLRFYVNIIKILALLDFDVSKCIMIASVIAMRLPAISGYVPS